MSEASFTETMARSRVARNHFQGDAKRVLCVCAAGLLRSPTAAWVLGNEPYNYNTRSAGIDPSIALINVDDVLLNWAQEVVCMNGSVYRQFMYKFGGYGGRIVKLSVPDRFSRMQPELIAWINNTYPTEES